ncbi:MAG: S9 family peptidase [Novosphingobium sp.]|nr:S9 family peptidase [Novosphingobium sp.]
MAAMSRPLAPLALLLLTRPGAALARPMTAEDVARLEQVGQIAVSPDGARVAYTRMRLPDVTGGEANGPAKEQLELAWGPGETRDFLPADMDVTAVRFAPDGRTIGFIWAAKEEKDAVWGIPVDGGGHRKLAEVKGAHIHDYAWAPDGKTIYLLAGPAADPRRETESKAGFDAEIYEEEWRYNRLFAARTGKEADASPREIPLPGEVSFLHVTPDGHQAIVATAPTPSVDDSFTRKRIALIDLATGRVIRTIETPGKIADPELAPDGRHLALLAAVDEHDPSPTTLHIVDLATGAIRPLNAGAAEAARDAEWLPDGRLAAAIDKGAQSLLRIYAPDGSSFEEIDPGALILTNIEAAGGTIAATADSPAHPRDLFVLSNGTFTRWTDLNPWLSGIDLGKQRTVTYRARDGQQIEGVLIEPVGGAPRGGAPTILDVHGGPEAHESNGWITNYGGPGQVAAGKGYAVFLPNYRGSTGYGTAFARQHQGDYAGKEFDDLVDGKRALAAMGVADPRRVGVTGGSYGGFATAWASTALSEEFAAGVMFVGISDLISKFGTTDIPREMHLVHELKYPWEEWQHLLERSPIYHTDTAHTPLLILHGKSDPRVNPAQSMELYRNIKVRQPGTPVRLVLYPGEGHGNRKAAARYDFNLRMLEWFDTYLKTGNRTAPMPPPRPGLPEDALGK